MIVRACAKQDSLQKDDTGKNKTTHYCTNFGRSTATSGNINGRKKEKETIMTKETNLTLKPIIINTMTVIIEGDSDLILNKMNRRTAKELTDIRKDKAKTIKAPNVYEDICTSMHWRDPIPEKTEDYTEDTLAELLKNNAPCISSFGLKKSFGQAVVRGELDKYATKFDANVNVIAPGNLTPITFTEHYVDEKLMSPKRGAPVLSRQNRFTGWSAKIKIQYVDGGAYGPEQIMNVINLAGFGLGIGSGRSSGFGRYHVAGVE